MINGLLMTFCFFIIVAIYYLLKKENKIIKPESERETCVEQTFALDNPPKNIGCLPESKPLSKSYTPECMMKPV